MINTKKIGNLTEMQCMTSFMELGYQVSIPFGEDSRYDFIADINGKLIRIQCKTCKENVDENNEVTSITFKTVRQTGNNAKISTRTKYTKDEIDFFSTFHKGMCYLVPVEECSNEKTIRFAFPKNNQTKGITFAEDCTIKEVLSRCNIAE